MMVKLKNILAEKHIKQRELARMSGLKESVLSRYIKGNRTPSTATLLKIARALDVNMEDIIDSKIKTKRIANKVITKREYRNYGFVHGYFTQYYCPHCKRQLGTASAEEEINKCPMCFKGLSWEGVTTQSRMNLF